MSDSRRFKRAVVFVCVVQKVERRLDRLSNESLPLLDGAVLSSSLVMCIDIFKPQTHQHWIPRRLRLKTVFRISCSQTARLLEVSCASEQCDIPIWFELRWTIQGI